MEAQKKEERERERERRVSNSSLFPSRALLLLPEVFHQSIRFQCLPDRVLRTVWARGATNARLQRSRLEKKSTIFSQALLRRRRTIFFPFFAVRFWSL